MNIIGAEDEDFENDEQPMVDDQCSHFNSIELLKSRPTHLLVFIHHVMLQFDCAPVLCYLHADLLRNFNAKDTRKHFVEFYNTFLDKGAILRVTVPSAIAFELDRTRPEMISEDLQKRYANEVQFMQNSELSRQLEDFRQKRMMGMTPNEHELNDVESHRPTDRVPMENKEKAVAETLLERMFEANPSIVADKDKSTAIFGAVALYMKHLGVKTRALDNKKAKTGWRPSILKPWGGNKLGKPVRTPGFIHEVPIRNTVPPHRDSVSDPSTTPGRKPGLGGLGSVRGSDSTEGPIISVTVSPSPDTPSDTGINNSRADTKHVPEAGDVSPVSPVAGPTVQESPVTEVLPEESQESISMDGRSGSDGGLVAPDLLLYQEEIDPLMLEFDLDPPTWREMAFSESLSSLNKKEVKRQEVINELYVTEHAHVRMLRVLQTVFFHPMEREEILSLEELNAIFPSLDEIIEIHLVFYETLKKQREEDDYIVKAISTPLLNRFNGSEGVWFQKLTARFCSHQSWALEQIKLKQKKDPRFNAFILEAESKRQCRRLQLKDIIPIEMQRLTKYPLLLENIAKNTENDSEKELINQAAECCRKILNHVNEEVKQMENLLILRDYQRRLDTSGLKPSNDLYLEHKNIDLTARNMLFEGPLTWKVTKEKAIDVHCVLLSDLLILLQKQDDRMVLKCQSKSTIVQEGKQMLSPIIKLESVFLRDVATDPKALYVIFAWDSGAQIYELVAQSTVEKKNWAEVIKSACEQFKKTLGNKLERTRGGSIPASSIGPAFSPLHPPLSPTENGGDLITSRLPNAQFKDLADMKRRESDTSLLCYLAVNGFDIMTHTPPEKSAVAALEEVRYLKRFLVGSISLSDDFQVLGENGEMQDGVNEATASEAVEGQGSRPDGGWISAPLVLSTDSIEEVQRRLQNLEEQVKRLQTVEEDHYKLQEALSKYSLQGGPYN